MTQFLSSLQYKKVMVLKLFVADIQLKEQYKEAIIKHNTKLQTDPFMDAGFDILSPPLGKNCSYSYSPIKIDFQVKCSAYFLKTELNELNETKMNETKPIYTGYYMYPRSSLSKTRLRLANSVGIIDSGYRGNLIGMFDCLSIANKGALCECEYDYIVKPFERLVQICAPNLCPIYVIMVDSEEELSEQTIRGGGGFGSTNSV